MLPTPRWRSVGSNRTSDPENTQNVKKTPKHCHQRDLNGPDVHEIFRKPLRGLEKAQSLSHKLTERLFFFP